MRPRGTDIARVRPSLLTVPGIPGACAIEKKIAEPAWLNKAFAGPCLG